jgi:hypothetical protein
MYVPDLVGTTLHIAITELTRDNQIRFIFWCFIPVRQVTQSPAPYKGPGRLTKGTNRSIQITTFYRSYFLMFVLLCHALAALGFGRSLPFCPEKRSVLLHESEGIFVALLGKHPFVVTGHESTTTILVLRGSFARQHVDSSQQ